MLALKIPIPSPMARARCIVEAITFPQLLLKGCEEGLLSGSYSRLSLVLAPGRSSEFSVFRALASQPRPEPCLSKFEGVGCEGCPVLSPASGDSNHNNHEGCLSLQKSLDGYIKLPLLLTRECTARRREVRDPPFLCSADLTGIRCLSLHKSSCRYIKLSASPGGGIRAGMRRHEGGGVTPSLFLLFGCCLNPHDTKSICCSNFVECGFRSFRCSL